MITKQSTTYAAEFLNRMFTRHYIKSKQLYVKNYNDRKRKHRLVPHQTDVDKFFRLLSGSDVHFIFGNLLSYINQKIRRKKI